MSQSNLEMLDLLNMMAEYHSADVSETKLAMYAADLEGFSADEISQAWKVYRNKPQNVWMPTPAQLKDLVPDGRPTTNQAWGMLPWDEYQSVVWNDEIIAGWDAARSLISQGQKQSAFFAFKETYEAAVANNKAAGLNPKWQASLGFDKAGREDCLRQAVETGKLSYEKACGYMPELPPPKTHKQIESGNKEAIQNVLGFIKNDLNAQLSNEGPEGGTNV